MNIADLPKNFVIELLENTPKDSDEDEYESIRHLSTISAINALQGMKSPTEIMVICSNQDGVDYLNNIKNTYRLTLPSNMQITASLENIAPTVQIINLTSYY